MLCISFLWLYVDAFHRILPLEGRSLTYSEEAMKPKVMPGPYFSPALLSGLNCRINTKACCKQNLRAYRAIDGASVESSDAFEGALSHSIPHSIIFRCEDTTRFLPAEHDRYMGWYIMECVGSFYHVKIELEVNSLGQKISVGYCVSNTGEKMTPIDDGLRCTERQAPKSWTNVKVTAHVLPSASFTATAPKINLQRSSIGGGVRPSIMTVTATNSNELSMHGRGGDSFRACAEASNRQNLQIDLQFSKILDEWVQ